MNVLYRSEMSKVKVKSYECTGAVSIERRVPAAFVPPYANAARNYSNKASYDRTPLVSSNTNVFIDCSLNLLQ